MKVELLVYIHGYLLAVWPGSWVVAWIVKPFIDAALPAGFKGAGKLIGLFERFLIFTGLILNSYALIGIVLTLKAAYRFGDITGEPQAKMKLSEYFIIGTFSSIAWVLVVFGFCKLLINMLAL